ncbi:MAG: sialidase family protein, partial [Janthinobacterium lividum]
DPARTEAYIPSPCVQNHAAQIMPLQDGSLGCVWFGGTQEGIPDISVYFARLEPGADRWPEPVKLSDDTTRSEQNPILFNTPAGELWLLHTAQQGGNQDTALVRRRISTDDGRTWGAPETMIPAGADYGVFVRQPPVVTADGLWLLPGYRCVTPARGKWVGDQDVSEVYVSRDQGASWAAVPVPGSTGCVHMSIVPTDDGYAGFFRSRWADSIYVSRSADGLAWSAPVPTELPNNNSSIQALALADGRLAMVFNASSVADATDRRLGLYDDLGEDDDTEAAADAPEALGTTGRTAFWGTPRAPMTLALSHDGGRTWPDRRDLDVGDGFCMTNNSKDRLNREYSYPSIAQTADGALHVAYTYFRRAIKYVRVPPGWAAR